MQKFLHCVLQVLATPILLLLYATCILSLLALAGGLSVACASTQAAAFAAASQYGLPWRHTCYILMMQGKERKAPLHM